jgi:hypothetical protein
MPSIVQASSIDSHREEEKFDDSRARTKGFSHKIAI